jgi:hypothetical protein
MTANAQKLKLSARNGNVTLDGLTAVANASVSLLGILARERTREERHHRPAVTRRAWLDAEIHIVAYCLICRCYPDGAIAADDSVSIDPPRQVAFPACSTRGAVGGSGPT